ncbi:hypothetical protein [Flagellimonas onchidii]|uniref:hypothetical protein n=1 Tax=Flagellimonas onchidii TaxID=2562684 RepID=UPI0010A5E870|nr:hypothetical protein [Allomuricauda onchidii]
MNVLQPIDTAQELIFIPRFQADTVKISLVNEFTEVHTDLELAATYSNGFMTVQLTHDFSEGDNYTFEVTDTSDNLMYRGKIFITAQESQNYNLNQDLLTI